MSAVVAAALPAVALLALGACDTEPERPTCSASHRGCGEGWECVEARRPLCPRICDPTYTCYAQGILEVGWSCIADSECVEGAFCRSEGDGRKCALIACMATDDCSEGERCVEYECAPTLGLSCTRDRGGDIGCAEGQVCRDGVCAPPPEEGGNHCEDDTHCAEGRACLPDRYDDARCATCASDAECEDPEYPYCVGGHCQLCSDASCGGLLCDLQRGCVECIVQGDCAEGYYCDDEHTCRAGCDRPEDCPEGPYYCHEDHTCRIRCDRFNDESCPPSSGACAFWEYCVRDFGTPCEEPAERSSECFDGVCVDRDASGATVEPYCTRECYSSDRPCEPGSECVEDVTLPSGDTGLYCLAT